jgi:hypothetical protein
VGSAQGNNGVGFGEPSSLGSDSLDSQLIGHSLLRRGVATNFGGVSTMNPTSMNLRDTDVL